ncbi:hypothetical protein [Planomicrobium sp. CPCC 101079]|uniref:hypothetical protein n=1 Tax=Planomicrobium sp. CPCC 101079 TaxID=2599618 RepID=UPI0011B7E844|nr:hypothetical protein [Planomicrobium sp. CPCC 101079]TWT13319.1 hypothetical protein FQV28_02500 [Planomicrobium sp. CPCC 101079]
MFWEKGEVHEDRRVCHVRNAEVHVATGKVHVEFIKVHEEAVKLYEGNSSSLFVSNLKIPCSKSLRILENHFDKSNFAYINKQHLASTFPEKRDILINKN